MAKLREFIYGWWRKLRGCPVHCWKGGPKDSTCMLRHGHLGPHQFILDEQIIVRFQDTHP